MVNDWLERCPFIEHKTFTDFQKGEGLIAYEALGEILLVICHELYCIMITIFTGHQLVGNIYEEFSSAGRGPG